MKAYDYPKLGNNAITLEILLSANFANMSDEDFAQAIKYVDSLNRLMISRAKCNSPEHYEQVIFEANICLRMMLLRRRQTDTPTAKRSGRTIDLDAEFGDSTGSTTILKEAIHE